MTNVYPIPPTDDIIDELGQAKFVVMLDLTQGYWKVPVVEEDNHKAFITPYMAFCLKMVPEMFQHATPFVYAKMYFDALHKHICNIK